MIFEKIKNRQNLIFWKKYIWKIYKFRPISHFFSKFLSHQELYLWSKRRHGYRVFLPELQTAFRPSSQVPIVKQFEFEGDQQKLAEGSRTARYQPVRTAICCATSPRHLPSPSVERGGRTLRRRSKQARDYRWYRTIQTKKVAMG